MYICSVKCKELDISFDYHDTERVLTRNEHKYFLTPKRFAKIEAWMIQNFIMEITTKEQVDYIIQQGWLSEYTNKL
jgi:hypothetical protein